MIDKQIMIDGVDVSKCMFFNKNYKEDGVQIKNFCELQYISCKEFDCANCYFKKWKRKEQECERLKWYLKEIRDDELKTLDIEWDEYETHSIDTEYSNIINLVEEALKERNPEDCRYGK